MKKGIFWKIIENDSKYLYSIKINCDVNGNSLIGNKDEIILNHKRCWEEMQMSNKPFNYYPRGRVEIKNGICKIFLSPFLCNEKDLIEIKKEFEINDSEFKKIKVIADNSFHYQYLMEI